MWKICQFNNSAGVISCGGQGDTDAGPHIYRCTAQLYLGGAGQNVWFELGLNQTTGKIARGECFQP